MDAPPDSSAAARAGSASPYEISFLQRDGYLLATVGGPNTVETIRRYSADVRDACARLQQTRVLLIVKLHGTALSMLDVYKAVASGSDASAGLGLRVAYVDLRPEPVVENMQIAEGVASTRGIPVRTFTDVGLAEAWLLDTGRD